MGGDGLLMEVMRGTKKKRNKKMKNKTNSHEGKRKNKKKIE
jgi:hypothetical protein